MKLVGRRFGLMKQVSVRQNTVARAFFSDPKAIAGLTIFVLLALLGLLAPVVAPYNPNAGIFTPLQPPSYHHWLGTTSTGQDVLSQFVWGTRNSMAIGLAASLMSTALAVVIGMYPAYRGGWLDDVMTSFTNMFLVIPGLPLMIVVAAYVRATGPVVITLVIALTSWAARARVLRAQTMTLATRDFVVAARLSGASHWKILSGEILPNMLSLFVASMMYGTLGAVLAEAGLEFLGLGNVNSVTWGTMLYWANSQGALLNGAWWWFVPGGVGIALLGTSLALMNFAMDMVSNPRLQGQRKAKKRGISPANVPKPSETR